MEIKKKLVWTVGMFGALALALPGTAAGQAADKGERGKERAQQSQTEGARYSDRERKSAWEEGRKELEQALKAGQERDFYRKQLEELGYQITSVNQEKADYLEYEIVKGEQTYEVQVDMDKNTRKAKNVDISWNMWKAEGTERALEQGKGQKTGDVPARGGKTGKAERTPQAR